MYTQCPSCDTVYRVTTEQIKLAKGDVRCGRCQVMFNALERLTDHVPPPRLPDMGPGPQPPAAGISEPEDSVAGAAALAAKKETPEAETPEAETSEETPEDETPEAETPEAETPEAETPEAETPEDETPEDETPEDETPEDETPEDETPEDETPEDETPEDETPEDETPEDETPEDETPEDETPEDETPEDETPEDETPEDETPEDETPEDETPEDETPEAETPEAETPEAETPEAETPVAEVSAAPGEPETAEPDRRPPKPRHPIAEKVPAGAAAAWIAVTALRQPRPRPNRAETPPIDPSVALARAKAAAAAAVMMPAGAPALWNATAAMLEPPPRRPRAQVETAPSEAARPASSPAVEAPWIPPAAQGAWVATAEMLAPPPRRVLPEPPPREMPLDEDHTATIPGIDIVVTPATYVPAAAAPAWYTPREMRGPLRRRGSSDGTPTPQVETPAAPELAKAEDSVLGRYAQAAPGDIEEIVLETTVPSHDAPQSDPGSPESLKMAPAASTPPASDRPGDATDGLLEELKPRTRKIPRAWLTWGAAVLGALIIAGTIVHKNRSELMRSPAMASLLGGIYGAIGVEARPAWEPGQYVILESAAEADNEGLLGVTTTFTNEAEFAQPYPVLRVTLQNRWGQPVIQQDFAPSAYLADYVEGRLLGAGEETTGEVSMRVPDQEAVGFNLNLCLEVGRRNLACAVE